MGGEHLPADNFASESSPSDRMVAQDSHDHVELKTEGIDISKAETQFKSFLGEEGYHVPPLSANLPASEVRQQLFDFSQSK